MATDYPTKAPPGFGDFELLPRGSEGRLLLLPTSVKMLEQGGDVLIYHRIDAAKGLSLKKSSMFRRLIRLGELPGSDTRVSALVVSGDETDTQREMALYDHICLGPQGDPGREKVTTEDIQMWVREWFGERSMRR